MKAIAWIGGNWQGLTAAFAAFLAGKAEKNSRPVSNGFTGHVMDELRDIRRMMLDHIISHDTPK